MEWSLPAAAASDWGVLYTHTYCVRWLTQWPVPGFPKCRHVALRCNVCLCAVCAGQLAAMAVFRSAFGLPLLGRPNLAHRRAGNARGDRPLQSPAQMWAACFAGLHRGSASAEETWEQAGAGQGVKDPRAQILMKVTTVSAWV
jgi:hypothetical protein